MRRTRLRSIVVSITTLVGTSTVLLAGPPARAHGGRVEPSAEAGDRHAAEDLAGGPMPEIEARTAARAAELGNEPPTLQGRAVGPTPGQLGSWSPVIETDVVPVFTVVLPNGRVLMWDSVGDDPAESYSEHMSTRALVWDPVTDTSRRVDVEGSNIFCAGYVQLPDGNVLVVGGNKNAALEGIRETHLFDWRSETWSRGPDMQGDRWYPSVAALGNGEALIVGGGPTTAEVYQTDGTLRALIGFDSFSARQYPFLVPRGDGEVEVVGPAPDLTRYDTSFQGSASRSLDRDDLYRAAGSFVTYDLDRTLVAGGGPVNPDGSVVSSPTTFVVDTSDAGPATSSEPAASMSVGRRQHNLTVLADGSVLATGGSRSTREDLVDLDAAVRVAEQWDPELDTWTQLSSAARVRQYHSSATLLPDGRVLTGGGGICSTCVRVGYLEKNIEYFSPPYLFAADGSPALRPTISRVPETAGYASGLGFETSSPIDEVALVRLGANTHSVDQGQRYVPLRFSQLGTRISAITPRDGNAAPPGHYMLFAVDAAGVPSLASIIRIGPGLEAAPTPLDEPAVGVGQAGPGVAGPGPGVTGPAAVAAPAGPSSGLPRCLQVRARRSTLGPVVRADCTGGVDQVRKRRADATFRPVNSPGRCLSFAAATLRPGTRVLLAACTGGPRQRMAAPQGTIRPAAAPQLCVSSPRRGLRPGARLVLRPCRDTSAQRWDWRRPRG
ncbi:MAG: DUF1929 domain-containing protein [Nocardioides sp.]|nr:DUF1929 domain-containing protein [Nocardioides sp.]